MINALLVGAGGFAGAICRYLISLLPVGGSFPAKTFVTNVLGAFVIGLIAAAAARGTGLGPRATLLLKTGFCGGFTTFSTFALESYDLMSRGSWAISLLYMVLSVVCCVLAITCAQLVVSRL